MSGPRFRRHPRAVRAAMLVAAGRQVLARGGIRAFTIDNICRAAGVSRGLVAHHFGGKDGLLAAVYADAYQPLLAAIAPQAGPPRPLAELLAALFSPAHFGPDDLNIWLAIWGEIAANSPLKDEHRALYARYRQAVAASIATHAQAQGRLVDAAALAVTLIALVDGMWLEMCLDPASLTPQAAQAACQGLLQPALGPIG